MSQQVIYDPIWSSVTEGVYALVVITGNKKVGPEISYLVDEILITVIQVLILINYKLFDNRYVS